MTSRSIQDIPAAPGTYALVLILPRAQTLKIGRLGDFKLKQGGYLYVGSAFGPGGLAARIAHHFRVTLNPRWHIDYLRSGADPDRVWYTRDPLQREHQWAGIFAKMKPMQAPDPKFGASDCRCRSHLYRFEKLPPLKNFKRHVYSSMPDHGLILEYNFRS